MNGANNYQQTDFYNFLSPIEGTLTVIYNTLCNPEVRSCHYP